MQKRSTDIYAFATKGSGTNEAQRLAVLLSGHSVKWMAFDKQNKRSSGWQLLKAVIRERPRLLVMEGTGLAGGLVCVLGRWVGGVRYVVSSGDAVGPFVGAIRPLLGPLFGLYERLLCRWCDGFVGWTPYLVGRALTFGAPRAVTAAGWTPVPGPIDRSTARDHIRSELGIGADVIVFGIVGALVWNSRFAYCYGLELVRAVRAMPATARVAVVVVGDGDGRRKLMELAGDRLGRQVFVPGAVAPEKAAEYWAAFDVASLPQSVDRVGSFRYTTKLSEILAAGLPVVTGQIPLAYDLDSGWLWRLPGRAPWSNQYVNALTALMSRIDSDELAEKAERVPTDLSAFDQAAQVKRVTDLISDLLADTEPRIHPAMKRPSRAAPA